MILAINTAFGEANLALQTENKTILKSLDSNAKHSENMLKTIDEMCQEAFVNINDVDCLAVVLGPGSFTGLRIGTAICQALGCVNDKLKFIGISSLQLMGQIVKENNLCDGEYVCVLNALSGLYFVANFDKDGILLVKERMINEVELGSIKCQMFGLENDLSIDGVQNIKITSKDLLDYANSKFERGEFSSQNEMLPLYLRLSQAEDSLLKKSKKDL